MLTRSNFWQNSFFCNWSSFNDWAGLTLLISCFAFAGRLVVCFFIKHFSKIFHCPVPGNCFGGAELLAEEYIIVVFDGAELVCRLGLLLLVADCVGVFSSWLNLNLYPFEFFQHDLKFFANWIMFFILAVIFWICSSSSESLPTV